MIMKNDYRTITERSLGGLINVSGGSGNTKTLVVVKHPVSDNKTNIDIKYFICS